VILFFADPFVPIWASFHYVQLYHNANDSDVDSFPSHGDGTKGQQQSKGEG